MSRISTPFSDALGLTFPAAGGAMYPCSNPGLVAAVSDEKAIGVVQPLSATYVYGYGFRESLQYIKSLTDEPFGMNVLLEFGKKSHADQMNEWITIALEEGCRFFVTALGKPTEVIEKVHAAGGIVYHKCTNLKHASTGARSGADGLILVNSRAGGHAGEESAATLYQTCKELSLPLLCAGGISTGEDFVAALEHYDGVLMGTRLIATEECAAHIDYKNAILAATEDEIVLTERVTGIPLSVIRTAIVDAVGTDISKFERFLFKFPRAQKMLRAWYHHRAQEAFKQSVLNGLSTKDYYQAGKGVGSINEIVPVKAIFDDFLSAAEKAGLTS